MKPILIGLSTLVTLAAVTAGCGYSERTYAVQAPGPVYERGVAVPGATYYGDRYYDYPTTTYVYPGY